MNKSTPSAISRNDSNTEIGEIENISSNEMDFVNCSGAKSAMGITYDTTQTGNIFSIDYSKRGTAKCKRCSKLITKDALRIGKLVQFKSKHIKQFLHIHCAIESFRKARVETSIIKDMKDLDGFDQLNTDQDKSYITKLFEDKIAIIHLPPPKELSTKEKITILATLKVRRSQL